MTTAAPSASPLFDSVRLPRLQASGKWVTTAAGEVVILHGVNLVSKTSASPEQLGFDEANVELLVAHGISVVRLGVLWCNVEPYLKPDGADGDYEWGYLESLKRTITLLGRYGIYTLVDFHQDGFSEPWGFGAPPWARIAGGSNIFQIGFPSCVFGGLTVGAEGVIETDCNCAMDAFWQDKPVQGTGLQKRYGAMAAAVAGFFADCGGDILGYDPHNEPPPGSMWPEAWEGREPPQPPSGPCSAFDNGYLGPFYDDLLPLIRRADPDAMIWFEPNMLFGLGVPTVVPKPGLPNIGFNFHNYDQSSGFKAPTDNATAYQENTGVPLLCSEFGATTDASTIETVCAINDANMLSWIYWAWFNNPRFTFSSSGGQLPADPRAQGVVRDMAAPLVYPNVNTDMLCALTRVYPRLIAGTPLAFAYAPTGRTFFLVYSTELPVPGSGANVTRIVVPAVLYPDGYSVAVTNGTVVSPQGAPFVDIAADPWQPGSPLTVTVDIQPNAAAS